MNGTIMMITFPHCQTKANSSLTVGPLQPEKMKWPTPTFSFAELTDTASSISLLLQQIKSANQIKHEPAYLAYECKWKE
jgi:hypothetical protein